MQKTVLAYELQNAIIKRLNRLLNFTNLFIGHTLTLVDNQDHHFRGKILEISDTHILLDEKNTKQKLQIAKVKIKSIQEVT